MQPLSQVAKIIDGLNLPAPFKHPVRIVWVLVHDLIRCDVMKQASAMAYVTLLSLIPSLVAVFCVLSLFAPLMGDGTDIMDSVKDWILENLASDSGESAVKYLEAMLGSLSLSKIGWSSFASVLVTLVLLLRQIELALNRIWLVHKGRNTFTRFVYFWTFLTLGMVVLAVALGVSSGFDPHRLFGAADDDVAAGAKFLSWVAGSGGAFLFFFCLYKIVPNCRVHTRSAAVGAVAAAVLLIQGGRLYGTYVQNAKSYTTLYGALAQLPLFLTWLYICWIIILLGALISWRTQEGFPRKKDEETLDRVSTPLDQLRNSQVRAALPALALVAIYKKFQQGTGHGLSGQDLAHALRLPSAWVSESLEVLEAMGYVVAAKVEGAAEGNAVTDPFFPAFPAASLPLTKLHADLAQPMNEWLSHWHHEVPLDLRKALRIFALGSEAKSTLAEALEAISVLDAGASS